MVNLNKPDQRVIMTGNEALARGALEAGVDFCSSYPGSPCVEVAESLFKLADKDGQFYGEWSSNEMVALEAAAAASFAGLRALCVMKQNGLAVTADLLLSLNHPGTRGGLVIVVGDDPGAHSSINEVDSRHFARHAEVPLLEPSTVEEARDMCRWAFGFSEQLETYVIIRAVTRICHARSNLILGELPFKEKKTVQVKPQDRFFCFAPMHGMIHARQKQARLAFEESVFNCYNGPEEAETVVVASGPASLYAREALELLDLDQNTGLLKIGTTWPLPRKMVLKHLQGADQIIFFEESDPFLEQNITSLLAQFGNKSYRFFGQVSGHISGEAGPGLGELNTDMAARGLARVFDLPDPVKLPQTANLHGILKAEIPDREMTLCPGCPHRSSFWAIKCALELDGRQAFVLGDIGCYTLGIFKTGFMLLRSVMCMGSGIGLANGFGQLHRFGMKQPVLAVMGDSTFFHACLPALVNGIYNRADFIAVVLDNTVTAMTGFQAHPGAGRTADGTAVEPVKIESITTGMGLKTLIADPHNLDETIPALYGLLQEKGPRVFILRKECALQAARKGRKLYRVIAEKCAGETCGCNNFCGTVFGCPAISTVGDSKASISDVLCTGCGACVSLCPRGAIVAVEEAAAKQTEKGGPT
jgi:indolepyruvate ferredoxin oxidoreductase, alpha subunit